MKTAIIALAILMVGCVVGSGCGDSGAPDPVVESKRVEDLTAMRGLYNKVNGNYDKLSEADKTEFVRLCRGDDALAKTTWDAMKYGSSGPPKSQ
jgi:hypothetical protein